LGDDVGNGKRFARAGNAQKGLVRAGFKPFHQFGYSLRLVAFWLEIRVQLKHVSPFSGLFCAFSAINQINPECQYNHFDSGGNHLDRTGWQFLYPQLEPSVILWVKPMYRPTGQNR
jgi:hypothetical protein